MNSTEAQYKTPENLNTRISIHEKYSINKQPFSDWIISHYDIPVGAKILELGCGTGSMWKCNLRLLTGGSRLILSDLSEGMLEAAKETVVSPNVAFQQIDIQQIPYPDASFDIVIANMMLYHVPDLHRGLSQVRRVLKPGGSFYCATYGIHGIMEYVTNLLLHLNVSGQISNAFTLQNGSDHLHRHFDQVQRLSREDGLAITQIEDFIDYLYSLSGLSNIGSVPREVLREVLESRMEQGILFVPKEYGMFVCK